MQPLFRRASFVLLVFALSHIAHTATAQQPDVAPPPRPRLPAPFTAATLKDLSLRPIGPCITPGRVGDIAIDPKNRNVWYVALASGGLWKTTNRGISWKPIFDNYGSYSIGCVAVDPEELGRGLARHRREPVAAQRRLRRRHLQEHRRRRDLDARRA